MATRNLLQLFRNTVRQRGAAPCFRYKEEGKWLTLDWDEVSKRLEAVVGALSRLGLKKGDRVCIFSRSRYEWTIADLAILACGGITVPIYESSTPDQAAYIIDNSEAKILFAENEAQLKKIEKVRQHLSNLTQIVLFEFDGKGKLEEGIYTLDQLYLMGNGEGEKVISRSIEELTPDSVASYVYTSGTTGPPKGAILTHGNFLAELVGLKERLPFPPTTESLLFLPLAHILARVVQFAQIEHGFIQCYAESIDKLIDNIGEVRPHLMASVPRIFEKVHSRVMQGLENAGPAKKAIFCWSMAVGKERAAFIVEGKSVPISIRLKWILADRLVFSKLKKRMGGRIEYFISGGAPLPKDIGEFFLAAGFLILEGYGLTETSAAVAVSSREALRLGTVGKPMRGVEIRIAGDGEILVRGGVVFKGYYKRPKETAEALTADGWFHTGDIGVIDEDGFLKITDRKKDIIVTAAGKNVAPQNIENLMKTDPLISQVMVHGDGRKFLSALVTLNRDEVIHYAKQKGISFQDYAELVKNEKIHHLIKEKIDEKNRSLAQFETIKKFAILDCDFSIETGELTPTLKVKRKFTSEKYKDILDRFYQD